ncbi:hypothetical protein HanXRQr2_Chr04g0168001 [Helianthus annuus]|uniref:Uncharacterized protein n=1 Tax=Helianthus annuus TaxID=4232 RepID=A0A9K3J8G5_HELAN|nr:hypothetical protein HanXRQr2_Chr04g0168001 [Helianthus annuus]KAJ0931439.1 hypothetical protein HanPSC8_Chr04g0161661 [Helianthus annuus]
MREQEYQSISSYARKTREQESYVGRSLGERVIHAQDSYAEGRVSCARKRKKIGYRIFF